MSVARLRSARLRAPDEEVIFAEVQEWRTYTTPGGRRATAPQDALVVLGDPADVEPAWRVEFGFSTDGGETCRFVLAEARDYDHAAEIFHREGAINNVEDDD